MNLQANLLVYDLICSDFLWDHSCETLKWMLDFTEIELSDGT